MWGQQEAIHDKLIDDQPDAGRIDQSHRQVAVAAWSDYLATGLHVTAEEADAWLARLEAGEDVEPPLPHQ